MAFNQDFTTTILVTGSGGQLGSDIKNISAQFPQYNFLFTTKQELAIENDSAVKVFFKTIQSIFVLTVLRILRLIKQKAKRRKHFV